MVTVPLAGLDGDAPSEVREARNGLSVCVDKPMVPVVRRGRIQLSNAVTLP